MNWSDEKYVKLYVRQTATWRMWPWQARCVFPLLLQVANGAGLVDLGRRDPLTALSVLIMVPREVVEVAIAALADDGTIEAVEAGLLIPKFLEAQEATKTEARKKADQRDRERAKARGTTQPPVTESHPQSPGVTGCPPPAQPSPAQPIEKLAGEKPPAPVEKPKKVKPEKPTDPRHAPLVKVLCEVFEHIRGRTYPFGPRDAREVSNLLAKEEPEVIAPAWAKALRHVGFPTVSTLAELNTNLAHFVGDGPSREKGFDPNQGIIRNSGPPPRADPYAVRDQDPFPWSRP